MRKFFGCLVFAMTAHPCHFERSALAQSEKSTLSFWALVKYGLPRRFCKNGSQWRTKKTHFAIWKWRRILSFWAFCKKAKNPRPKNANSHFKFVDTSLCYAKFSMTRVLSFWAECVSTKRKIHIIVLSISKIWIATPFLQKRLAMTAHRVNFRKIYPR